MSSLEDLFGLPENSTPPLVPPVKKVEIPDTLNGVPVTIDESTGEIQCVEMSEQEQMDQAVSVSRGVVDVSTLLDYYKKVFARSPEYYAKFAERVRKHAFL
jgi:hypothetical protein